MSNLDFIKKRSAEARFLASIVVDASGSVEKMWENFVNALDTFVKSSCQDEITKKKVDLQVVTFNDEPTLVQDFAPIDTVDIRSSISHVSPSGCTNMNKALNFMLDNLEKCRNEYKQLGTYRHHKKLAFLISDGAPTEDMTSSVTRIKKLEKDFGLVFYAIGINNIDCVNLKRYFDNTLFCEEMDPTRLFNWLSKATQVISESAPGEKIQLPALPEGVHFVKEVPPIC